MIMMMMMRRESKIIERWEGERKRVSNFLCFVMHNMLIIIHIYIYILSKAFSHIFSTPIGFFSFFDAIFFWFCFGREKNNKEGEREREFYVFSCMACWLLLSEAFSLI